MSKTSKIQPALIIAIIASAASSCGKGETPLSAQVSSIGAPDGISSSSVTPVSNVFSRLDDLQARANQVIDIARGTDPVFEDTTVSARTRSFSRSAGDSLDAFSETRLFAIPSTVSVSSGSPGSNLARFRIQTGSSPEVTCYYQGNGWSDGSCGAGGNAYNFQFCVLSSNDAFCTSSDANLSSCRSNSSINLGIASGETVTADASLLQVSAPSSCTVPTAQITLSQMNAACGGTATTTTHLLGTLDCPSSQVFGLHLRGSNLTLKGHNYRIQSPAAVVGLLVAGDQNTVSQVTVNDVSNGYGILAFDPSKVTISGSKFQNNLVGIDVYSEQTELNNLTVSGNDASSNSLAGIRLHAVNGRAGNNPVIQNNTLTNTGGFALMIQAKNATIDGSMGNDISGSMHGIYLTSGNFNVQGLNLSTSAIPGNQLLVMYATNINLNNSNLTYTVPGDSGQTRVAAHFYNVSTLNVSSLTVNSSDVGIKVAIDSGYSTQGNIQNCTLTHSSIAGIMIQSYDGTGFGSLNVGNNNLTSNPSGYAIWKTQGTNLGGGSNIQNNSI